MDTFSSLETTLPFDLGDQQQQYKFILDSLASFNFSHYIFYYKNIHSMDPYYGISNLELKSNGLPIFFSLEESPLALVSMKDRLASSKSTLLIWNTHTWPNDADLMYLLHNYPTMFGVTVPIFNADHEVRGSICFLRDHVITVAELLNRIFAFRQMLFSTQYALEKEAEKYIKLIHKTLKLNQRQVEILRLLAAGMSTTEVAKALDIQLSTVNYHLKTIYQITDCNNRTTAVYKALKAGLLD